LDQSIIQLAERNQPALSGVLFAIFRSASATRFTLKNLFS
jgi:hypothetical protein